MGLNDIVEDPTAPEDVAECVVCNGSNLQADPCVTRSDDDGTVPRLEMRGSGCKICKALWWVRYRMDYTWSDTNTSGDLCFRDVSHWLLYLINTRITSRCNWHPERASTVRK
jgi:hypothetical protein